MKKLTVLMLLACVCLPLFAADDFPKPYSPPCTERENVFAFTEKPAVKTVGEDRYEITFAVKGACDVTVGIVDPQGVVVRHLGSGVLGANAPAPFQKNSLKQTIYWNGKDDLDWYVKEPEKLKVRVMLGLKPEFDKCLGGSSPYNIPGYVFGLAAGPDGVYVLSNGDPFSHLSIRKFDHDGKYVQTLVPPPADLPEERLGGLGYIEYEPGKRAVHSPNSNDTTAKTGSFLPGINVALRYVKSCQPALVGNRLYYTDVGYHRDRQPNPPPSLLYYLYTDGGTDVVGMNGLPLCRDSYHPSSRLAASSDGKTLYLSGLTSDVHGGQRDKHFVLQREREGAGPARRFVGDPASPGHDNEHLNNPLGVDCDSQGRVYIADQVNNRIQIYAADGKHVSTIPVDGPHLVRVHQKTGAIYVQHTARVEGKTVARLTKFASLENPKEEYHVDGIATDVMAVDSWAPKTRLWMGGPNRNDLEQYNTAGTPGGQFVIKYLLAQSFGPCVTVWEETDRSLRQILDFDQTARGEDGPRYLERWPNGGTMRSEGVVCDPTRETAYFRQTHLIDLRTGNRLCGIKYAVGALDDIAFDKRGYMHLHYNPCLGMLGVARVDPAQATAKTDQAGGKVLSYAECLYDYGIEKNGVSGGAYKGVLEVRDQCGAKGFQDGVGVNMMGDVAVQSNIYYVPKMGEESHEYYILGPLRERQKMGFYPDASEFKYERFIRDVLNLEKEGGVAFFHKRQPGLPLSGGTVWVFRRNGELDRECAAITGDFINGCRIDEDGAVYFVTDYNKVQGEGTFLRKRGGIFGAPKDPRNWRPFTGTLIKTDGRKQCRLLEEKAPIPMEPLPARAPDLMDDDFPPDETPLKRTWVEGAAWLYAGAPIVTVPCSCPTTRFHTDWYKRTFVPEWYRHSIGVLDTNGNLIMHLGRYGNWDSGNGPQSRRPLGGDNIAVFIPRFISGTDNYLVFADWGERLAVLKLNYHTEESVGISNQ